MLANHSDGVLLRGARQFPARRRLATVRAVSLGAAIMAATSTAPQAEDVQHLLDMMTAAAAKICQEVPLQQTSEGYKLSGDAQATLKGILKNLAGLGISGDAQYQSKASIGVLQKDLAQAIEQGNDCRRSVFLALEHDLMHRDLTSPPPAPSQGAAVAPPRAMAAAPPRSLAPATPPAPPAAGAAAPAYHAVLPPIGTTDIGPAFHLAGQSWEFTIDGARLVIRFLPGETGPAVPSGRAVLSDSRFGSDGVWQALSSVSYQVRTDANAIIMGWFQQDGSGGVTGCELIIHTLPRAVRADSNQPAHLVSCHRVG